MTITTATYTFTLYILIVCKKAFILALKFDKRKLVDTFIHSVSQGLECICSKHGCLQWELNPFPWQC